MKNPVAYSYRALVRDLWSYIRPYKGRFVATSWLRLSGEVVWMYGAYVLAQFMALIAKYIVGAPARDAWFLLMAWITTTLYVIVTRQLAKYWCYEVAQKINLDSQLRALRHVQQLNIAWHEKENTGNRLKRIQNGGQGLERLLRIWIDNSIQIAANFIGMIVVLSITDLTVGFIMIVFLVTYIIVNIPFARASSVAARLVNEEEENYTGLTFEVMNNIRTVKVMGMFHALVTRLTTLSARLGQAVLARIFRFRVESSARILWAHLFRSGTLVFIVYGIVRGQHEVAFLFLFNFYFMALRESVEELSEVTQDITVARYSISRLQEVLHEPITIDDDTGKVPMLALWKTISLRNVCFAYGNHQVLNNLSFDIHRGERIGIVGLSGVGKSTLFKLLCKEYENFTGDILFDNVSIRSIQKSSYFHTVAVVLQDTEVFNFSLRDNITIGSELVKEDVLQQALAIAHVNDFIGKLPQGLTTLIGEKGVKLSGGEKQRVGIARAVFKQPQLLLLDEATSHLDIESEEKIRDSLHTFFQNVTSVVIAHRLTTIQEMDKIILLEQGTVSEVGSFNDLYAKRGKFFNLWEKQKLKVQL